MMRLFSHKLQKSISTEFDMHNYTVIFDYSDVKSTVVWLRCTQSLMNANILDIIYCANEKDLSFHKHILYFVLRD